MCDFVLWIHINVLNQISQEIAFAAVHSESTFLKRQLPGQPCVWALVIDLRNGFTKSKEGHGQSEGTGQSKSVWGGIPCFQLLLSLRHIWRTPTALVVLLTLAQCLLWIISDAGQIKIDENCFCEESRGRDLPSEGSGRLLRACCSCTYLQGLDFSQSC